MVVDAVFLVGGAEMADKFIRRMKRLNHGSIYFYCVLSCFDLITTSIYLRELPDDDDRRDERIANEVVALLPDVLCPLILFGGKGKAAIVSLGLAATAVKLVLSSIVLKNDLDDL